MNLYLIRHADAGDPRQWPGDDADRPLTDLGRRQARALGDAFARVGVPVEAVAASPYARTRQTAEEFLGGRDVGSIHYTDLLVPGGLRKRRLGRELAALGVDHVAVVGHNMDLSVYLGWLIGAEGEHVELEKGAAALVTLDGDPAKAAGRLAWVVTPDWYLAADGEQSPS